MPQTDDHYLAPKWLSKQYLEKVLQKFKNDQKLVITKLELAPAIPKGENFASVMTRAKVSFNNGDSQSLIVKADFENNTKMAAILAPYQAFQTEMAVYDTVLPKLNALLQQIGDMDKLFADVIHVDYENEAIMFEDLAVHDFCLADRLTGLDMVHAKMTLSKLAKMHATAAVLNERTNGALEKFTYGLFNHHTRGFGPVLENLLTACADYAGDCDDLGDFYKDKLLKLKPNIVDYALRATDVQAGHFHTLVHGDLWTNNIMMCYDEQQRDRGVPTLKDLLLIDFQFCKWSSPAIDLHYFFNTSLESDIRFNNQDELVQFYHGILYETLSKLGYSGHKPSLHKFHMEMEERRFYAVNTSLVTQTFMINDSTEECDLETWISTDNRCLNLQRKLYDCKAVQDNVKKLLPIFNRRGLLDITN